MTKLEQIANEWWVKNRDLNIEGEGTFGEQSAFEVGYQAAAIKAHEILISGGGEYEIREWAESLTVQGTNDDG